jgi:pimeloyl-ACP methyl ester carboxylesterase
VLRQFREHGFSFRGANRENNRPMTKLSADASSGDAPSSPPLGGERTPCPAPADFRHEVSVYDARARVGRWKGPRYRLTYRTLGQGPPLLLVPGMASTYRIYALLLNRLSERFQTIVYDYPGDQAGDRAKLAEISHQDLVSDLFGLLDHLKIARAFPVGISFGSTVVLRALYRRSHPFPRAAILGGFSHRRLAVLERLAVQLAKLVPGTCQRLPLRRAVLTYNSKLEFPSVIEDRFPFYLEQNGLTPIRSLAHRASMLAGLDLRPILPAITGELLLIQGNEDRIVPRRDFDALKSGLPGAESMILPTAGHQLQLTHAELLARLLGDWFLPGSPAG